MAVKIAEKSLLANLLISNVNKLSVSSNEGRALTKFLQFDI